MKKELSKEQKAYIDKVLDPNNLPPQLQEGMTLLLDLVRVSICRNTPPCEEHQKIVDIATARVRETLCVFFWAGGEVPGHFQQLTPPTHTND